MSNNFSNNRPLSKLASKDKTLGDLGTQNRSVLDIHEGSSTKSTTQFASKVEFRKSSIKNSPFSLLYCDLSSDTLN